MAFAAVADAVHYNDGSGIWYWGPALIVVAGVSSLLRRAATLRLTANGYLRRVKRVVVAATTVLVLLTAILSAFLDPRLVGTVNGQLILLVAVEFLGFNGLFLAAAWLLPPRWPNRPVGARPRRFHYLRWIPVPVIIFAASAALIWHQGGRMVPWLVGFGGVISVLVLVLLERNFRNQEDGASALGRRGAVLLLRTFSRDLFVREEMRLAKEARRQLGHFTALGNPSELLPPPGAKRLYLADDAWRAQLTELAGRSAAIVMWPDATPSVRWELAMIRDRGLRRRLFVIVPPPWGRNSWLDYSPGLLRFLSGLRLSTWGEFAQALQESGYHSPESEPRPGTVFAFDPDGRCVTLAAGIGSTRELVARIAERLAALPEPVRSSDQDDQPAPKPGLLA
jgi:hypothetical protein